MVTPLTELTEHYYTMPIRSALQKLDTSEKGISSEEAAKRLAECGANELKEGKKTSALEIFLRQFKNVIIWILIFATVISAFLKEYIDAIVILVIIALIAVLGFVQEFRAEKAIEALKKLAPHKSVALRNGQKSEIDAKDLVPGDIILLETGNKVPADALLFEVRNFQTQEASLTGESTPVTKTVCTLAAETSVADRKNCVFSGTVVVSGKAKAVVTATGMKTEIGKIAAMLNEVKPEPTPLQKKMDRLGATLSKAVVAIAAIVLVVGIIFQKAPMIDMLLIAVAVAVAAIPEGLPAIVTLSLALGTQRMLKRHALIRRLPSVETLGSTTVICADKTGTLTTNQMTVRKLFANGKITDVTGVGYEAKGEFLRNGKPARIDEETKLLLKLGALNNNAELKDGSVLGDPTEGALIVSAAKAGMSKASLEADYKRIDEIEFTSERKIMTTIHKQDGNSKKIAYVKGAPEIVLKACSHMLLNGKELKLTDSTRKTILDVNRGFADTALRVLGFAYNPAAGKAGKAPEKNLVFVGLQAMIDPPRTEIKAAIEKCRQAGIKVIIITGDHESTAQAVAREIGLEGKSLTGAQLDTITNLEEIVEDVAVFARVDPEHKIKIVSALKKKGHVVAMTGDGVNDAPALKKADIGIAMGITGTDVSKEASAMILTDDNFASIVNAVEEGRGVYDNIRKYLAFLLSGNISEVLIIVLGIIFGLPLPLTATQILLINLVTDGLPALALSTDPFEPNAMSRKPRRQDEPVYSGLKPFLLYYPIAMTAVALAVFSWFYFKQGNYLQAQTATFLTIGMFELYQAFASRSTIYPALKVGIFKNRLLVLAVLSSFVLMAAGIFIPVFGKYIDMVPLSIPQFAFICIISSLGAVIIEVSKYLNTRKTPC